MPSESVPDRRSFVATVLRGIVLVVVGGVGTLIAACSPSGVGAGGQGASRTTTTGVDPVTTAPDNSIDGAQSVDARSWTLRVTGLVSSPVTLTYAQLLAHTPKVTRTERLSCVEGFTATYVREGIRLGDLL